MPAPEIDGLSEVELADHDNLVGDPEEMVDFEVLVLSVYVVVVALVMAKCLPSLAYEPHENCY